tara:strand:- start:320 stop:463 length:144 start_codon:yes stop_codon:yes gene_type:complete
MVGNTIAQIKKKEYQRRWALDNIEKVKACAKIWRDAFLLKVSQQYVY